MPDNGSSIKLLSGDEARAHLAAIVDSTDDSIVSKTLDGIITSWNRGAEELYGFAAEEVLGRHVSIVVPRDRLEELDDIAAAIKRGERVERLQTVRIRKDGTRIDVSLTQSPVFGDDGSIIGISVIGRDITAQVQMERELRESERRYRTIVEMAHDAVVVHQDERFVYANCAALGIYGARSIEELQQVTLLDLVHPDEREVVADRLRQLLEGEEIPLREYKLLTLRGEEVSIETSSALIDYQGRPSIQIIARDITERKRAEAEREKMLRELAFERSRFDTMVRQLPVGVLMVEAPSGRMLYDNDLSRQIFRQEPTKVETAADYLQWKIRSSDGRVLALEEYPLVRALRGEVVKEEELQIVRGDGTIGFVRGNAAPLYDEKGAIAAAITIFEDVTVNKAALQALAASEERLNLALEAAEMGSCDIELPSGRGIWSRRYFLVLGYEPPEGGAGAAWMDMWQSRIHPDDRGRVNEALARSRREGSFLRTEHRVIKVDNHAVTWVNVMGRYLCDDSGETCRFIAVIFDVTERKSAEEALRRSEKRFRVLADSLPHIIWTAEPDGTVDYLNLYFTNYTGLAIESLGATGSIEQPEIVVPKILHPQDVDDVLGAWHRAVATGEIYQVESRIRRADGVYHWYLSRAVPERDDQGVVVKWYGTATDINDLREAQERLKASEAKFRWLYDSNMIAIFFWARDGRITEANGAFCELLGFSQEQCREDKINWRKAIAPESESRVLAAVDEIMSSGMCKPYEKVLVNQMDGHRVPVLVAGARMVDGEADGIGFAVDLTEQKRAEEALRQSERRFRQMADSMPQIFWTAAPDGSVDYLNAHFDSYTGLERAAEAVQAKMSEPAELIMQVYHPDDAEAAIAAWSHAVASGEPYHNEGRLRRADGVYHWHLNRAVADKDDEGRVIKWYGTATDINDLREAQEKLQASEAKFRWLYDSNLIAIFFWRWDGQVTEANTAFCRLVGHREEDCRNGRINWRAISAPDSAQRDVEATEEIRANGMCRPYEKFFLNESDGSKVPVLLTGAIAPGDNGTVGIAFAVDLTEQKRAEEALKKSEATLKLAVETAALGIFEWDIPTGRHEWSEIAKEHHGLLPDSEVDHALFLSGVYPDDRELIETAIRDSLNPQGPGVFSAEYRTMGVADRKIRWLTARGRVLFDQDGTPQRMVGACLDITHIVEAEKALKEEISERLRAVEELRKQEQLLIRQGRMAAMGEMIGNIAHQWRQPLNTMALIVQELPRYYQRNLFTKEYLDGSVARAMQVINYMSKTIDGFRNFFGPDKEKETFRAGEVLARTVSIVEAAFTELNLKIRMTVDEGVEIYGYPNEFSQVVLNILVNAKDAILERKVKEPRVDLRLFREDGKAVLTIADNAGGIAAEIVDKIFDPYFTTKGPDKGTGIGLFMSKTIIEKNMNGSLTVRNTEEGAEFRIEV